MLDKQIDRQTDRQIDDKEKDRLMVSFNNVE